MRTRARFLFLGADRLEEGIMKRYIKVLFCCLDREAISKIIKTLMSVPKYSDTLFFSIQVS